jgi:hypothetical protein
VIYGERPLLAGEPKLEPGLELGPTMTGQGNLSERSTIRDDAGVGGSVAGCDKVCPGTGECVARSTTVRDEGENVTS